MRVNPIPIIVGTITAATFCMTAYAATSNNNAHIQAQYKADQVACMNGKSSEPRATCLEEARAAMAAAKGEKLDSENEEQLQRNRISRCQLQPKNDRDDCMRRMDGNGIQSGSTEQGGIMHEEVSPALPNKAN